MKTHTIKWNGDKTIRIITFSDRFFKKLKTAKHDQAVRVILHELTTRLLKLTGKKHTIAHHQELELIELYNSILRETDNYYEFMIKNWMFDGISMAPNCEPEKLFELLNVILPIINNVTKGLTYD